MVRGNGAQALLSKRHHWWSPAPEKVGLLFFLKGRVIFFFFGGGKEFVRSCAPEGGGRVAALPGSPEEGCGDVYNATVIIPGA